MQTKSIDAIIARTMSSDEKILKALEGLQTDVTAIKDVQQKQGEQLEQQGKDIAALKNGQEQQGKLLNGITATVGTVLEEQQSQRVDIRSLHTEVHETREELKGEIRAARAEAKADNIDLKATVVKKIQSLDRRVTNIEEHEGIENPDKN
jgi:Fic family protein